MRFQVWGRVFGQGGELGDDAYVDVAYLLALGGLQSADLTCIETEKPNLERLSVVSDYHTWCEETRSSEIT